jgi:hypothetical protein
MTKKFLVPIVLPADPAAPMEAVTKQYVDVKAADEVWVGPDDPRPANPTIELWYDSDDTTATALQLAEIFYTELTTNLTISAVNAASANTIISSGNVTYDGSPVMFECFAPLVVNQTNSQLVFDLWDGNTDLGFIAQMSAPATTTAGVPLHIRRRITPSAGVHNFSVRGWGSLTGSVPLTAGAGGPGVYAPAYFRATRVTQGGGATPAPSSGLEANKPAAATALAGLRYFATDTLRDWLCDGVGWIIMSEPPVTSFVPAVYPSGGAFTLGANTFSYRRSNGNVDWSSDVTITNNGNGTGVIVMSLPFGCAYNTMIGTVREDTLTGLSGVIRGFTSGISYMCRYDNGYLGGTNYRLLCGGSYLMASRYT